ncbi:3-hydroxybutyryl-CoA dehydrogenase-like [Ruditapes philippinarum]|uniref:3-hydroxybutyryl-CoA dehydrogenase-like n=1 Tax=Ruditapes philippinarum TaxID=129788 RepID=UPI00295C39D9|nr:3-hydroxybutyryl-CoA dehydrogenase-like [Ruditapes philippinarum]
MVKVAVLGSGLLGTKIAGELAYHGHRVKIYSNHLDSLNTVFQRMEEDKHQLRQDGILLNKNFIGQVLCLSRLEETVCDADFVFECIPEDLEMKKDLFERVSHLCKPGTIIATNTLRLNVTEIVERTVNKERTLGLRFLYPVFYIPEVEITPNNYTSGQVIEKVRNLLEKMGKTLFFRSGSEPLILTEDQRDDRKKARQEEMKVSSGMGTTFVHGIPNLRQISVEGGTSHGVQDNRVSTSDNDLDCAICMDKARDCVMRPCHHMVTCYMCAAMLINRRDGCPICRKDIIEIIRVYSG